MTKKELKELEEFAKENGYNDELKDIFLDIYTIKKVTCYPLQKSNKYQSLLMNIISLDNLCKV